MKWMAALIVSVLLVIGTALAAGVETPPVLLLERDDMTERPVRANFSWTYPTGNRDEWSGTEACGIAPTDPAVLDAGEPVCMLQEETYTFRWDGDAPDELMVFSWDINVLSDPENADAYQQNPEIVLRPADGQITLKPDRIYHFQSKWSESETGDNAYGNADDYLVTLQIIMEDGPGMAMIGGWTPSADPSVTDELKALFEKGTATLTGASAVPVAYLGSQVVAGTNHAFLCQQKSAYPELPEEPAYMIVYLYEDLQGNVSILNIADFDVGSLCTYGADS